MAGRLWHTDEPSLQEVGTADHVWSLQEIARLASRGGKVGHFFVLIIALFWLVCGTYIAVRPTQFIRNTQFPWANLPVWGARVLGVIIFVGGTLILGAYILHRAN